MAVKEFLNRIYEAIKGFLSLVKGVVKTIVKSIVDFAKDVVGYFRNLELKHGRDIPFITRDKVFKEMLKDAPVKNVGIFTATYNTETEQIENLQYVAADQADSRIDEILENESIVVLK